MYAPCDANIALDFMESVYDKLYEVMDTDAFLIIGADFNACITKNYKSK